MVLLGGVQASTNPGLGREVELEGGGMIVFVADVAV